MSSPEPLPIHPIDPGGGPASPRPAPGTWLAHRLRKRTVVMAAIALLVAGVAAVRSMRAIEVTASAVVRGTAVEAVYATGTVEAVDRVTVKARTAGAVLRLHVREGGRVRRGEILATIDARPLVADLTRARAESRAATRQAGVGAPQIAALDAQARAVAAELGVTRGDFERARTLVSAGSVATSDLDRAGSRVTALEAQLASLSEQRRSLEIELAARATGSAAAADSVAARLADAEVRAPIDGVVLARLVEPGEVVAVNQPLFRIGDVSRLELECAVDEADVGKVRPGNAAAVALYAFPRQVVRGRITEVMPDADRVKKSFLVKVGFEEPPPGLRSGMSAEVNVVVDERAGALLAPAEAISPEGTGWVIRDGRLEHRKVRTGVRDLARAEVLDGLLEGELVVTSSPGALRDGVRVHAIVPPLAHEAAR